MSNGTSPGVTVKGEGYVVAPTPAEIAKIVPPPKVVTMPSGVTISAEGYIVAPTEAEKLAIVTEVKAKHPELKSGDIIDVTYIMPDTKQLVTVTMGEPTKIIAPPKFIETPLKGELGVSTIYGRVAMPVSPEVEKIAQHIADWTTIAQPFLGKPRPEQVAELKQQTKGIVPEPLLGGIIHFSNLIETFKPPQPDVKLLEQPVQFMGEALATAIEWSTGVPVHTLMKWNTLTPSDRNTRLIIDAVFMAVVWGRPIARGIYGALTKSVGSTGSKTIVTAASRVSKAVKSGNPTKIRVAANELQEVGFAMRRQGIEGADIIIARSNAIIRNADRVAVLKGQKMPVELQATLKRLGKDIDRIQIVEVGKPLGADVLKKPVIEARGKVRVATVPISRGEARSFGLSAADIDSIFSRVGESRSAFLTEARGLKAARLNAAFDDINRQLAAARELKPTPVARPAVKPTTIAAKQRAEAAAKQLAEEQAKAATEAARQAGLRKRFPSVKQKWIEEMARVTAKQSTKPVPTISQVAEAMPSKWQPYRPFLTKEQANKLMKAWAAMKPHLALRQMLETNMLAIAIATNARIAERILSSVSAQAKAKALAQLSPAVREAILTKNLTKAKTEAQIELQTQTQTETATSLAIALAHSLATQGQTKTQIQSQVKTALQEQVQAITQTQVKTKLQTQVAVIPRIVTKLVTKPPSPRYKITPKPRISPPKYKIPPPPIIITLPDGTSRDMTPVERAGSVAWKQGFIYRLIYPPYGQYNVINSRKPFAGIPTTTGAKSAYETLIRIGKKLPATIRRDMGIMDIQITTPKVGKPVIGFKRDIKQRTRLTPRRRKPKARRRTEPRAMLKTMRG